MTDLTGIGVTVETSAASVVGGALVAGAALLVVAVFIIILVVIFRRRHRSVSLRLSHDYVVLLMRMPKESGEKETREKQLAQQIAPAETFFAILGGMRAPRGPSVWLHGRQDNTALEIVAERGQISFYFVVRRDFREFFEQQAQAQFPTAQFEEVGDYNAFTPQGVAVGTELSFVRPNAIPIRSYKKFETDPLDALTNALSRLGDDEAGVIQYVFRTAHSRWHRQGRKIANALRKGHSLRDVMWRGKASAVGGILSASFNTTKKDAPPDPERPMLSQTEQQVLEALEEKNNQAGLELNIRLVVSARGLTRAKQGLHGLVDAFSQFRHYESGNGFHPTGMHTDLGFMRRFIYRSFSGASMFHRHKLIVSAEEMASLFHPPLPTTETPKINWLTARKLVAPVNVPSAGILLGQNMYRGARTLVHMKLEDRRRHMYVIGTTGTGKSVLMSNMAIQDIKNGEGIAVVDPHGSLVEEILENVPEERIDDVVYFDPSDVERPIGLNMLEATSPQEADFAVQEMIAIFYKLVTDPSMIGPMFEHNMRNAMLTLMANTEYPGTIADIPRIFTDPEFQKYSLKFVTDPIVRSFWEKEMAKTTDYHKSEMLGYLISKVGRFVENAMMRNIIGQPRSGFNLREIMDKRKILLVNLSKGKVGEMNSNLLGLIIVSKLQMAALARADVPEHERPDFFLYVDEFQNFITDSIAVILSEARKYRLNMILAHQYIGQLVVGNDTKVRDAVFGNVGTVAAFRIGVEDAEMMAKQLAPAVTEYDLINIEKYNAYVRLLIDNSTSRPFTMQTFPPSIGDKERALRIRALARLTYGRPKAEVDSDIMTRTKLGAAEVPQTPVAESHA